MSRLTILMTVALAAAATGCISEREAVRDDRRVEAPPHQSKLDYCGHA